MRRVPLSLFSPTTLCNQHGTYRAGCDGAHNPQPPYAIRALHPHRRGGRKRTSLPGDDGGTSPLPAQARERCHILHRTHASRGPRITKPSVQQLPTEWTMISCPTTYHEFVETAKYRANPPDLVARSNTGMSEVEVSGWEKSMRVAFFTAYTEAEAITDTFMLIKLGASFVKTPEKNPWRRIVPLVTKRIEHPIPWHRDIALNLHLANKSLVSAFSLN
ncbi:MYND-type domain-containing protein [Mycena venus]|uniref:MYND-type domain-containing protein n=1 Tax=Mycena venus TaxID=2733690 RepID=A0A8H6WUQ9_9AGAR|nr:MYND-type domain-containing protein [Mycena venus]